MRIRMHVLGKSLSLRLETSSNFCLCREFQSAMETVDLVPLTLIRCDQSQ